MTPALTLIIAACAIYLVHLITKDMPPPDDDDWSGL